VCLPKWFLGRPVRPIDPCRRTCMRAHQQAFVAVAVALVTLLATGLLGGGCQASPSIRISPSRVEKQIRKFLFWEDRSIGPIKVVNSGTSPLRVRITIEDLYQTDDGSAVFVTDGSYEYGAADLVTLEPAEFVVEPGMTQLVKGTVDTSSGRRGGGYCVAFFETLPDTGDEAVMATASRVGALLYIVFPGPVQVAGSIDRLEASTLYDEGNVGIRVRLLLHNSGDVHVCPSGILRLKTMGAVQVCDGSVTPENVLPDASRWLTGDLILPADIPVGQYLLEVTMFLSDARSAYAEGVLSISRDEGGDVQVSLDHRPHPIAGNTLTRR
jgi:hypothetical protein